MWHLAALQMGAAWDEQPDASGIVVAVLDTGLSVDADGVALAPGLEQATVLPGYDFVHLDDDPADDNGHGTMVAGVLGATGDVPGIAPRVSILPVKVLDALRRGSESAIAEGIDFAVAAGADVISMSLAFPRGYMPSADLALAIDRAADAGVVLVAAAGNHALGEISFPAAFGEVIAVGGARLAKPAKPLSLACAVANHGSSFAAKLARAEYSAYGAPIDVCAAGGAMDHDLDGNGLPDAVPAYSFSPATPSIFEPYLVAGTSPASAEVAGVAALLLAAGAEPHQVAPLLQDTAKALGPAGFHTSCGTGLVQAGRALARLDHGQVPELPARFVNPVMSIVTDSAGKRRALALIELVDADHQPVVGATLYGHFRGAVSHDWSAVTDDAGRVLVVSLPATGTSRLFELAVDKVVEDVHGQGVTVIVPQGFSRFEAATFRWMSAFMATGAGIAPSPFSIMIDPDALAPWIDDFDLNMQHGADPTLDVGAVVSTVPPDVVNWALVPTLVTRSLGGTVAPKVIALDRQALISDCNISPVVLPVLSQGAGIAPSPFRISETLLRQPLTLHEVLVQPDKLFLDGQPATETELGLYWGEVGNVLIDIQGSVCEPGSFLLGDLDVLSDAVMEGQSVQDGGFHIVLTDGPVPMSAGGAYDLDQTALGAGLAETACSTGIAAHASAAVQGFKPFD